MPTPRSLRRRGSRATLYTAVAVIAVVLAAVAGLWAVGVVTFAFGGTTAACGSDGASGTGPTPLGSAFALSPPAESVDGGDRWYNFSVESAAGGLTFGGITFLVKDPSGTNVAPVGLTSVTAVGTNDTPVARYDWAGGSWSVGGDLVVTNQERLVLGPTTSNLGGDTFVLLSDEPCGGVGSVEVAIP